MRDWLEKLLHDRSFEEALVLLCLSLATAMIFVAAATRMVAQDWSNAGFDILIGVSTLLLGVYTWRTRKADLVGRITAIYGLVIVIAIVYLFGTKMLFWAFPGTILTFFLLRQPLLALQLNLLAVLAILPGALDLGAWTDTATFLLALITCNLLALTFSDHMHRSRARLRLMAERDALTGARNRYALDPMLLVALDKVVHHGTPASLLVVDLDHFKEVNDTFGHGVGDRVLQRVTQTLITATRAGDDVFRYGGEELVILANGAPSGPAGQLAEKLRRRIEQLMFDEIEGLTVSIGVSEARPGDSPHDWFGRADECMYQAKRAGRNRVFVEGEPLLQPELRFNNGDDAE